MAAQIIEALNGYGCDTATAMKRFLGNEELYLRFLDKFLEDPSFGGIAPAMQANDNEAYFESVHTLKGVAGNLSLTPVYELTCYMVDKYRADEIDESKAQYSTLEKLYNDVVAIIKA